MTLLPSAVFAAGDYNLTFTGSAGSIGVTVDGYTQSMNSGDTCTVSAGKEVALSCFGPSDGVLFTGWSADSDGALSIPNKMETTFTMPDGDVKLSAETQTIVPNAFIDDSGILAWDAVEGFESRMGIKSYGGNLLFSSDWIGAQNGQYTYDIETGMQQYEEQNGSLADADYQIYLEYRMSDDSELRGYVNGAATYHYAGKQTKLATPTNLYWDGFTAHWDTVENAESYKVYFYSETSGSPEKEITVSENECSAETSLGGLEKGYTYKFCVSALPADGAPYSESDRSEWSAESKVYSSRSFNPVAPSISVQPKDDTYTVGDKATALSVSASVGDGGTMSYQWYSNTTDSNTGGKKIDGATSKSYTPDISAAGTTYYYCVVTNTLNGKTADTASDTAKVEVKAAVEKYDLYIGNYAVPQYQITSENAADVFGDGTVSYDPDTCVLTLNNAKLQTGILTYGKDSKTLTIRVIGDCEINKTSGNAISLQGSQQAGKPMSRDKLIITGDGTLTINGSLGISTYDDVTIQDTNLVVNASYNLAIAVQRQGNLNIIGSNVTATTDGTKTNVFWTQAGNINIQNSTVIANAEESTNPAFWALGINISGSSDVTVTGGSGNALYSADAIDIDHSTVKAIGISDIASPAIYAIGNITVQNGSDVTADSKGLGGITTEGNLTVDNSTVTSNGANYQGTFVVGKLTVNHSKLTSLGAFDRDQPAIVAGQFDVTASEVIANGGIELRDNGIDNVSFSITPAEGKLMELKVDDQNGDGSSAVHFKGVIESPYDTTVNFDADEMNQLSAYRYIYIGEHIHVGGTATCHDKAVCSDCGREYGDVDMNNHIWENDFTVDKEPTCTEAGSQSIHCQYCGATKDSEPIEALGHKFTNYVYNNNATCTANGTETAKCDRCNATDTREKAGTILAHQAVKNEGKEATCTEEGYTGDTVCKVCGKVLEKGKAIPKLDHNYKGGKCTVCGATDPNYKSNLPKTGDHSDALLWIAMLGASAGILGMTVYGKRKKQDSE